MTTALPSRKVEVGTFIKTNSPHVVEILGTSELDFGVIDAEHSPFDRHSLDMLLLAGKAAQWPLFVRIPDAAPATILNVLDCGATGILVPHVDSAEQARNVVARARYRGGERGFSSSPRAAGYGTLGMKEAIRIGDLTRIMCQIESAAALAAVDEIAAVAGVDGLFIGRADLALSLGLDDVRSPIVLEAIDKIIAATLAAGKIAAMFVGNKTERDDYAAKGVSWFVIGSDHSFMRQAANGVANNTNLHTA
jgi:2-keto-3-deoxy-L-rhamnonate aldolase RhmA